MPTQTITILNQANAAPSALARVERAFAAQSMQLRRYWNTPCLRFGPSGWKLYLKIGPLSVVQGVHYWNGKPYGLVFTGGYSYAGWSVVLSHEVVEMLVDPKNTGVRHNGEGKHIEVADPVESQGYCNGPGGVCVSDFVLPSYYAGGMLHGACQGAVCIFKDPLPGSSAGWPYDFMHVLTGPWQMR